MICQRLETIYLLIFFQSIINFSYLNVIPWRWHATEYQNPFPSKRRIHIFYKITIMGVLFPAMQSARTSATTISTLAVVSITETIIHVFQYSGWTGSKSWLLMAWVLAPPVQHSCIVLTKQESLSSAVEGFNDLHQLTIETLYEMYIFPEIISTWRGRKAT